MDEKILIPPQPAPQYFVDINEPGDIVGCYLNEIHGDNIPATARSITVEEWRIYSVNAALYKMDGETIRKKTPEEIEAEYVEPTPDPPSPEQLRIEQLEADNLTLMMAVFDLYAMILPSEEA